MGVLRAQRLRGYGGGGVAGDDQRLCALVHKRSGNAPRELQDLLGGLVTIGRMGRVAKEDKALVRQLGDKAPQHREAAHSRVEHPHKTFVLLRHAFLPTIPAWNQYATRSRRYCGVELLPLQPQAAVRGRPKEDP